MKTLFLACIALPLSAGPSFGEIGVEEVRLWKGGPNEAASSDTAVYEGRGADKRPNRWLHGVTDPVVTLTTPHPNQATGAAVVIFPGGGYSGQAIDKEGHDVAERLAKRGILAAVVPYRCGGEPHRAPVPLDDAQRSIQLVRSRAAELGVNPSRIGVMGFSAGGHLAAMASNDWLAADLGAVDPVRRVTSRPDFAVLVYPVISMRDGVGHRGSRRMLLGDTPTEEEVARWSADERVTGRTPPTLLVHSADDRAVPTANPLRYFQACLREGVPAELHVYPSGGHGYGMWATEGTVATWPAALEAWLAERTTPDTR